MHAAEHQDGRYVHSLLNYFMCLLGTCSGLFGYSRPFPFFPPNLNIPQVARRIASTAPSPSATRRT